VRNVNPMPLRGAAYAARVFSTGGASVADGRRRERRRKLGLPEELTEEEKAAEHAKAEAEAAEATRKRLPVKPVTRLAKMRELVVQMKKASAGGDEARLWCLRSCAWCL
jgi:hypothetical protein